MNRATMQQPLYYNVLDIIRGTTVDGPGFRTAIYFAGCSHRCRGCHNPESWNSEGGVPMSLNEIMDIVREEDFNVTFTGGDPLFAPEKTVALAREICEEGYNIWLYTGYTYEEILKRDDLKQVLKYIDTIVDGPYIESLRDTDLQFRGSSNQRIIHLRGQ